MNIRSTLLVLSTALGVSTAFAKETVSRPVLRDQLLAMLAEARDHPKSADAASNLASRHERHRAQLKSILETIGWPTRDLVGANGERAALELLHAECTDTALLQRALQLLSAAVTRGAATKLDLARLLDASRVGQGRLQLYGTQYSRALDGRLIRFPIEGLDHVDERRKLVGLPTLREQDVSMSLATPSPLKAFPNPRSSLVHTPGRLQPARGLNSVQEPRLGIIYVHSRDDPRAPEGEYPVPSNWQSPKLTNPSK